MEAGEEYWAVLDQYWDVIDIDSPEVFESTFNRVPRSVGLLYAAHFCQSEVCNGGFTQFFWNSTGVLGPEAVEGFRAIGRKELPMWCNGQCLNCVSRICEAELIGGAHWNGWLKEQAPRVRVQPITPFIRE